MSSAPVSPSLPDAPRRRFLLVTAFAWAVIGLAALLTPISLITILMMLAGSYGTKTFDPIGFLIVVVAPPAFVAIGFGLLFRARWAWYAMVVALAVILVVNVVELFSDPTVHETTTFSPSGVRTTVISGGRSPSALPIVVLCVPLMGVLFIRRVRAEFGGNSAIKAFPTNAAGAGTPPSLPQRARDWRVGHVGRDEMYYEERVGNTWQRIIISGEMLTGQAHHVIYFPSRAQWEAYPDWARDRREEIIARIKQEFAPPDYEYDGDHHGDDHASDASTHDPTAAASPAIQHPTGGTGATVVTQSSRPSVTTNRNGLYASLTAVALLLGGSAYSGWQVIDGLSTGATRLPIKVGSHRAISLADNAPMFYASIAIYAIVAIGMLGLILWGLYVTYRSKTASR